MARMSDRPPYCGGARAGGTQEVAGDHCG